MLTEIKVTTLMQGKQVAKVTSAERELFTLPELKEQHPGAYHKALEKLAEIESAFTHDDIDLQDLMEYHVQEWGTGEDESFKWQGLTGYKAEDKTDWSLGGYDGGDFITIKASISDTPLLLKRLHKAGKITRAERRLLASFPWYDAEMSAKSFRYRPSWNEVELKYDGYARELSTPKRDAVLEKLAGIIGEELEEACRRIVKSYQAELEYRSSEEYLTEQAEANEHLFTATGAIA